MKILLAPDKFKGSLTAREVCEAISKGLKENGQNLEIIFHPMADGGDGSLDILSEHLPLSERKIKTCDPLGQELEANYLASDKVAFIEVASASGLVLLPKKERNPMLTSTYGTGLMMKDALEKGCRELYIFLGGSATNDGGTGMAHALGIDFFDESGKALFPKGENLSKIHRIESKASFDFSQIKMTLLCDVKNPLFGPNGAAHVYAKQKGATALQIEELDQGLRHFSEILFDKTGHNIADLPGAGAAGGIGASMVGFFGAELRPGFETISELTGLEEKIKWADYVISGEGRLDHQSLEGKVIDGVAQMCRNYEKPFSLFVGKNELPENELKHIGAEHVLSIFEKAKNVEDAMQNGGRYLRGIAGLFEPVR